MKKVVFMLICGNEACDDFIWFGETKLRPTPARLPGGLTDGAFELTNEPNGEWELKLLSTHSAFG